MRKGGGKVGCLRGWAFALALSGLPAATAAEPVALPVVPQAVDLQADARTARQRNLPILLVFASESCSYCQQLERDYLRPMLSSGEYTDKILIRRLFIRDTRTLTDFGGDAVEAGELARRYRVDLVPTLVFVDAQGRELAERMVGLGSADFYWGYLQAALDSAVLGMHAAAE